MVLIFTAKEHNENSYTKSEKNNKSIMWVYIGPLVYTLVNIRLNNDLLRADPTKLLEETTGTKLVRLGPDFFSFFLPYK